VSATAPPPLQESQRLDRIGVVDVCTRADIRKPLRTGDRTFDDFVSELLELLRHVEAERLGGLKIDDKLILSRRLHR